MRPTFLQFRSPKERTPDPYDVKITSNGSYLEVRRKSSPTFGRQRRFKNYEEEARKTGFRIGPGSYIQSKTPRIKGGVLYKPLHGVSNDCFYVGNLLVRENSLLNPRITDKEWNKKLECSRPTTASDNLVGSPNKRIPRKYSHTPQLRSNSRLTPKIE